MGQLWLSHAPDLPSVPVVDGNGQLAGVLLGFPIDLETESLVSSVWRTPGDADLQTDAGLLNSLARLGGRFLWICQVGDHCRIYPDAATQISCVWDRETESVGATALAILDDAAYAQRFDHAQFATLCEEAFAWFPAGLTAHAGVSRLLPNHYLNLDTWTAHRFDIRPHLAEVETPEEAVDLIIATVRAQLRALVPTTPTYMMLSGGYDTRALLACAQPWAENLTFVTVDPPDQNQQELLRVTQMCQDHRLRHRILQYQTASRAAQELYLRRSGHCAADTNLVQHPTTNALPSGAVLISGLGAEIARAPLSYPEDDDGLTVTPALLLSRLGLPGSEKTMRHLRRWLGRLDGTAAERIFALAYLENRVGPWAMAQYCANPGVVRHAPFLTYASIHAMQALPRDWTETNAVSRAIVGRLWPEMMMYPFSPFARDTAPTAQAHAQARRA